MSRALVAVYTLLVGATLLAWAINGSSGSALVACAGLIIAVVKVRFIGRWFMELREAPKSLQIALDAYLLALACVLVIGYAAA